MIGFYTISLAATAWSDLTIDEHKKDVLHDVKTLATQVRNLKDKPPKKKKRRKLLKKLLRQMKND